MAVLLSFAAWMQWPLWPCTFAEATGLPCPGCGLTRATSALFHGEWRASWQFHPFAGGFLLGGIFVIAAALLPSERVETLAATVEGIERRTKLPAIFLVAVLCFGLLRMLGFWYQPEVGNFSGRFLKGPVSSKTQHTGQ
ncbi:DUF2752 domain-containing protein [Prosthecobacter sp.]|uniref:DUF2752 domain-containing protein n=1 Tax=Prosthecobacter sp. TaxID=1965333 RepID=UPI003784F83F